MFAIDFPPLAVPRESSCPACARSDEEKQLTSKTSLTTAAGTGYSCTSYTCISCNNKSHVNGLCCTFEPRTCLTHKECTWLLPRRANLEVEIEDIEARHGHRVMKEKQVLSRIVDGKQPMISMDVIMGVRHCQQGKIQWICNLQGRNKIARFIFFAVSVGLWIYMTTFFAFILPYLVTSCFCCGNEPIDVVYTWVNGSEKRFLQDLQTYRTDESRADSYAPQRFSDKEELKYSLRSLEKHMPWFRHVYIVTNGQIPSWLNLDYEKVSIVTHEQIFECDHNLPTFSSAAIEANLHRIPGLSENFIYFNDDVFLNADVYRDDFHTENGGYKIYTAWGTDCARKCEWSYIGNRECNPQCYNEDCDWDGGDCDDDNTVMERTQKLPTVTNFMTNTTIPPLGEQIPSVFTLHTDNPESPDNSHNNDQVEKPLPISLHFPAFLNSTPNSSLTIEEKVKAYNEKQLQFHKTHKSRKPNKLIVFLKHHRDTAHSQAMSRFVSKLFPTLLDSSADANELTLGGYTPNKDLYSASLIYTQKIIGRMFGYARRNVIAHAPIMINRYIMAEAEVNYAKEFHKTTANRFRKEENLQIAYLYSYYKALVVDSRTMEEIFDEYDTDESGTWADREIITLLSRIYPHPLQVDKVLDFQRLLLNCTETLPEDVREVEMAKNTPCSERYAESLLVVVTRRIVVECKELSNVFAQYDNLAHRKRYKTQFVESTNIVSFNQLQSGATQAIETLNNVRRKPRKFVCMNDDLDRTNATAVDNEYLVAMLTDLFQSFFPLRSKFELPDGYRNKYGRMDQLRAWQTLRFVASRMSLYQTAFLLMIMILALIIFVFLRERLVWMMRIRDKRVGMKVEHQW